MIMIDSKQTTYKDTIQVPRREFEALVGGALLKTLGRAAETYTLKLSKLAPKQVHLPKCNYTFYYHEREAVSDVVDTREQPTLLFFHGISQKSEDMAGFIASLDIPQHIRVLVPEQAGHGRDIERARSDPDNYVQPTHISMLESTSEFLDVVQVGNNTNVFGISLGGAVGYYVAHKRPDIIKHTVLVSPAILPCVDETLLSGLQDGSNNFFCFESRNDVKLLMRDLSTGRDDYGRKKKDPIPKFLYETLYRNAQTVAPKGHYKAMLLSLLTNAGLTESGTLGSGHGAMDSNTLGVINNPFAAKIDVDPECNRLVLWPEKDRIINCEQGKQFFQVTSAMKDRTDACRYESKSENTEFETIPDCGHVFHADGTSIMDIIRPRVREHLLRFSSSETPEVEMNK